MLGTLDRTPPPFFRQGYSAITKLVVFSAAALFLMVADTRLTLIAPLRSAIATALNPAQRALLVPVAAAKDSSEYLKGLHDARQNEESAKSALAAQGLKAAEAGRLAIENQRLRALLELRPALTVRTMAAEVLYEAADPYSRKVFIDRGSTHGVLAGSPVVSERGVVGQVTRAYPISSEVTLVVDKNAALPVINTRTEQRHAAFGGSNADTPMELRFVSSATDLEPGDVLQTSGLDGVYPPGLPVATVASVQRHGNGSFSRVVLTPAATLDSLQHVLVLDPVQVQLPDRPAPDPERGVRSGLRGKRAKPGSAASAPEAASAPPASAASTPSAASAPATGARR
jgi:rod shape-determining protein MreC